MKKTTTTLATVFVTGLLMLPGYGWAANIDSSITPQGGYPISDCVFAGNDSERSVTCNSKTGDGGTISVSALASASYGALGGSITSNGYYQVGVSSSFLENFTVSGVGTAICPTLPGVYKCHVGDVMTFPVGTTLNASAILSLNGTFSINPSTSPRISTTGVIKPVVGFVSNGSVQQYDASSIVQCGFTGVPACGSGGSVSRVVAFPVTVVIGQTYQFSFLFDLTTLCQFGCSANFGDPALTSFAITDPISGLPVSGLTVTAEDGAVFPVNPDSSVPEPATMPIVGAFILAVAISGRR